MPQEHQGTLPARRHFALVDNCMTLQRATQAGEVTLEAARASTQQRANQSLE